jgi:hypothetical protein
MINRVRYISVVPEASNEMKKGVENFEGYQELALFMSISSETSSDQSYGYRRAKDGTAPYEAFNLYGVCTDLALSFFVNAWLVANLACCP